VIIRLTQKQSWLLLLTLSFLVSLLIPSIREAHLLCLRLLLPLHGKTFVQGEPGGCIIYTIPNVQFSESYRNELIRNSRRTADDFASAFATQDWASLRAPTPSAFTNHPLLQWAALTCSYLQSSYHSNTLNNQEASELVRVAQAANQTNGALWLAEALVSFDAGSDTAAVNALRMAAEKRNWMTDSENNFHYLSTLYQNAGLSQLDAAIEANNSLSEGFALAIQSKIKEHLRQLMTQAVNSGNDNEFLNLLNLLVELRKADWPEGNFRLQNVFRFFAAEDDLSEAMRKRMKLEPESSSDYGKQREFQQKVFRDYLAVQENQTVVSRFWGQADLVQTERKLRREINDEFSYQREAPLMLGTNLSGVFGALLLYLLVVATLQKSPFVWLRKSGAVPGKWPRKPKFWTHAMLMLMVGLAIGTHFFLALGVFAETGFPASEATPIVDSFTKALLTSGVLSGMGFFLWFAIWKDVKKPVSFWYAMSFPGYAYLIAIVAMAYLRFQIVESISLGF
jgi:hypothetical protein